MEDELIEVTVKFNPKTYNEMLKAIRYQNLRNEFRKRNKPTDLDTEDFITGCVNLYLNQLKTPHHLSGLSDLGRPYRLKNHFKQILKKKGMIQKDLADKTGIDPSNISIILSNRSQPSLDYFLRIWIALNCPPLNECLSREENW